MAIHTSAPQRGGGRPKGYYAKDKERLPSVTTILSRFKESGALMQWAFKQGQSGAASLYAKAEEAAAVGSYVHDCVEADILRLPRPAMPATTDETFGTRAASALGAWESWRAKSALDVVHTELPLVSERHRFGGTIDAIAMDGTRLVLLDWKTSNGVYSEYLLQLAAYGILWDEHNPNSRISGYHLVRFSKEAGDLESRYWPELEEAGEMFLTLRRAYELDQRLKKRV